MEVLWERKIREKYGLNLKKVCSFMEREHTLLIFSVATNLNAI